MTATTPAPRPRVVPEAEQYARVIAAIERTVDAINADLGFDTTDPLSRSPRLTFGYLGNDGDVLWCVFLPHPGRVGTTEDWIGEFRNGDLASARAALGELVGFRRGLAWKRPTV